MSTPTIDQVAARRGWQTALQGLGIDVLVAVCVLIAASLDELTTRAALVTLAVAIAKTAVGAAVAWVIRRYADRSGVEEITPPMPPGQ